MKTSNPFTATSATELSPARRRPMGGAAAADLSAVAGSRTPPRPMDSGVEATVRRAGVAGLASSWGPQYPASATDMHLPALGPTGEAPRQVGGALPFMGALGAFGMPVPPESGAGSLEPGAFTICDASIDYERTKLAEADRCFAEHLRPEDCR